jgi:hypothetical protein
VTNVEDGGVSGVDDGVILTVGEVLTVVVEGLVEVEVLG